MTETQSILNLCGDCNEEDGTPIDGVPYATHCERCGLLR